VQCAFAVKNVLISIPTSWRSYKAWAHSWLNSQGSHCRWTRT